MLGSLIKTSISGLYATTKTYFLTGIAKWRKYVDNTFILQPNWENGMSTIPYVVNIARMDPDILLCGWVELASPNEMTWIHRFQMEPMVRNHLVNKSWMKKQRQLVSWTNPVLWTHIVSRSRYGLMDIGSQFQGYKQSHGHLLSHRVHVVLCTQAVRQSVSCTHAVPWTHVVS